MLWVFRRWVLEDEPCLPGFPPLSLRPNFLLLLWIFVLSREFIEHTYAVFWRGIWSAGRVLQNLQRPHQGHQLLILMRNGHFGHSWRRAGEVPAVPHLTYHCACAQRWICLAMALCFLISWDIFISGLVLLSVSLLNSGDLFLISFCWL